MPALDEEKADRQVRDFCHCWLGAQNAGDFDWYSRLYASGFNGTKRARQRRLRREPLRHLADSQLEQAASGIMLSARFCSPQDKSNNEICIG